MRTLILIWMTALAPGRDHTALATAIDDVVREHGPLFNGDLGPLRTAALMTAIAFRESSLRVNVVGDKGRSVCAFQVLHGDRALLTDAHACADAGYRILATSIAMCPTHPVAVYAEGPRGCVSPRAQRISRDRMWLASRLARQDGAQ